MPSGPLPDPFTEADDKAETRGRRQRWGHDKSRPAYGLTPGLLQPKNHTHNTGCSSTSTVWGSVCLAAGLQGAWMARTGPQAPVVGVAGGWTQGHVSLGQRKNSKGICL